MTRPNQPSPDTDIDKAISSLPPCLFEIPDDEEYAKSLAGQIRAVPITQDTRKAIKQLIVRERIKELELALRQNTHYLEFDYIKDRIAELSATEDESVPSNPPEA